jgi:hypothetical protein
MVSVCAILWTKKLRHSPEEHLLEGAEMGEGDVTGFKELDKGGDLLFITNRRLELKEALFDERAHGREERLMIDERSETAPGLCLEEWSR